MPLFILLLGTLPSQAYWTGLDWTQDWTQLFGSAGVDTAMGYTPAVDGSGNIYVAGDATGNLNGETLTGSGDAYLVKFNSTGHILWTRLSGVSTKTTYGYAVAAASGNVVVAGYTKGNLDGETCLGSHCAYIVKYNNAGVKQFTKLATASSKRVYGHAASIDASGNIYMVGTTNGALNGQSLTGGYDAFLIKYNSDGVEQYTKLSGVAGGHDTEANAVTIDGSGNIFVTGVTPKTPYDGYSAAFLIKYNSAGVEQYTKLSGVALKKVVGSDVVHDGSGNIFVTGYTKGNLDGETKTSASSSDSDAFLIKYDNAGTKQFTRLSGVASASTRANSVRADTSAAG